MLRVAELAHRSDTGRQRTANEDSFYARAPLFAVADGMGGARAGEVASRLAAESFEPAVRSGESPERYLRAIAERANDRIHELAQRDSSHSGMGTTLDRRAGRGRRGLVRARRRQPRVRLPRRRAQAADLRPLAGRGAASPGPADRGSGRGAPAALDHHPGARPRGAGRGRHAHGERPPRRRVPALLGRADDDGQGRPDRGDPRRSTPISARPPRRLSPRPTRPAGATTSPWSRSGSRRALPTRPTRARR